MVLKQVLVVVPFKNIYPPMNGGMNRCINILDQLSRYFRVTVIIHQEKESFLRAVQEYPELLNCQVISTSSRKQPVDIFSIAPVKIRNALRYRYWNRSLKGRAGSDFLVIYPCLKKALEENEFDCFILEDMSILNLARLIRRFQPQARIIYDAYNVNSRLAEAQLKKAKIDNGLYVQTRYTESNLSHFVKEVFTCSNEDLSELMEMNNNKISGTVIPNGVRIKSGFPITQVATKSGDKTMIFCGSMDYFPNQEGLIWFCKEVFPLILREDGTIRLMVVGHGNPGRELSKLFENDSINFVGMVDDVYEYYQKAALAIVPLLSGSGTRLKLLEAMGTKTPVVSTGTGAEGITYINEKNILIADDQISFAQAAVRLLKDRSLANTIAAAAYSFVKENYDWDIIGRKLDTCLNKN